MSASPRRRDFANDAASCRSILIKRLTTSLLAVCVLGAAPTATAEPLPGGTLDPTTIPKYVTPLVIPPVMNDTGTDNDYDIAVRQFQQQILPGGHWNTLSPACAGTPGLCDLPATTVWSYGPASDPKPDSSGIPGGADGLAPAPNSQFNYPAYTIENTANTGTTVDWINHLVENPWRCDWRRPRGRACWFIPHLLPIDRSLHWANPEQLPCADPARTIDCRPAGGNNALQQPYDGPVPIITHVHGAHVGPESDGYPEAWYLPASSNIPNGYATEGTLVNQYGMVTNNMPGVASFSYPNDQPSTTLWYHDHTLGMTRNNVYAGPAGFWLIREDGGGETGLVSGTLPGPAPVAGEDLIETNVTGRGKYREIPIAIQGRSFNQDGSLFYPANRAFFEGLGDGQRHIDNETFGLDIAFIGDRRSPSDISAIWNPEAFFNVMVVNGVSWPVHEVEPDLYRFRLLNGCNSRFLNLAMFVVNGDGTLGAEIPFYQIGAEQSLLPKVVMVSTGFKTELPGDGTIPDPTSAVDENEALLMGLAERADVLVDFTGLPPGTVVRMINTGPDEPFGGFEGFGDEDGWEPADPSTTGQVMQFVVGLDLEMDATEDFTAPEDLVLSLPDSGDGGDPAATLGDQCDGENDDDDCQDLALLEEESEIICVLADEETEEFLFPIMQVPCDTEPDDDDIIVVSFAPKAAVLGVNGSDGGEVQLWSDPIAQNPDLGETQTWELWNWSADAHPIHLHLVKFKVVNREPFDVETGTLQGPREAEPTEAGWKDTVIAYPGEVTRVNATFDIAGLYVWHCHIVEHEDNEMMVPYCVGDIEDAPGCASASGGGG